MGREGEACSQRRGSCSCPRPSLSNVGNRGSQLPQEGVIVAGLP